MRTICACALGLLACCPPVTAPPIVERPHRTTPTVEQPTPKPRTTFAFHGKTFTLGEDQPYPPCEHPEFWLTYVRAQDFTKIYCARCSDSAWCHEGSWRFTEGPHDGFWCNELTYLRYAIGAQLGVAVPPGRFARYFGEQRWYVPQPSVTEADLPAAAIENLAWLRQNAEGCSAQEDQRIIDDWFDAFYAGRAVLPQNLYDNCERIAADRLLALVQTGYSPRTPVVREDDTGCAEVAIPAGGQVISAHIGAPLTAEPCEECEGHAVLQFIVDRRRHLVALAFVQTD